MGDSRMRCCTATIALLLTLLADPTGGPAVSQAGPLPPSAHYVLVVDKTPCGQVRSLTGGPAATKPLAFQVDVPLHKSLTDWIATTFAGKHGRSDGSIMALDSSFIERSRLEFNGALLTEVALPALDA